MKSYIFEKQKIPFFKMPLLFTCLSKNKNSPMHRTILVSHGWLLGDYVCRVMWSLRCRLCRICRSGK